MRCEASSNEGPSTSGRGEHDLLIAGPGVLGSLLGKLWKDAHPMAEVVGQTNSDTNHQRWAFKDFYSCWRHCSTDFLKT